MLFCRSSGKVLSLIFEAQGYDVVKAWEKLFKSPAIRIKTNWLEGVSKWIDEGYEFIETSTGVIVKSGGDEIVEIVDDIPKLTKHKVLPKPNSEIIKHADDVNPTFPTGWEAPYAADFPAIEFKTVSQENFVRVYKNGSSNPDGRWFVKQSDIDGMTPAQIKEYLAIPGDVPDMIIDVAIPPDILLRTGKAAPTSGGAGGVIQFDLPIEQAKSASWYTNARSL